MITRTAINAYFLALHDNYILEVAVEVFLQSFLHKF